MNFQSSLRLGGGIETYGGHVPVVDRPGFPVGGLPVGWGGLRNQDNVVPHFLVYILVNVYIYILVIKHYMA